MRNPNGPAIEEIDEWRDAEREQAEQSSCEHHWIAVRYDSDHDLTLYRCTRCRVESVQ